MRKKTISHLFDSIFWYLLYFLPVLAYLIYIGTCGAFSNAVVSDLSFSSFLTNTGISNLITTNPVYIALTDIFAVGGIFGFVEATSPIFVFLTWFVNLMIMHLMVDFLLFIPRLCHKWLKAFTQGDD